MAAEPSASSTTIGGLAPLHRPDRSEREPPLVNGAPAAGTLVLCVGYRGAKFSGFAEQPGMRTVAGELRHALSTVLRREVELVCAGRTDSGVHALSQFVSVPVSEEELKLDARTLSRSLVALTPDDISIRGLYRADALFSARFDATSRSYRYRIATGDARPVAMR